MTAVNCDSNRALQRKPTQGKLSPLHVVQENHSKLPVNTIHRRIVSVYNYQTPLNQAIPIDQKVAKILKSKIIKSNQIIQNTNDNASSSVFATTR